MAEERILPPFPDEFITRPVKRRAIAFLSNLRLPGRSAAIHLIRWGEVTGVEVTRDDLSLVNFEIPARKPE